MRLMSFTAPTASQAMAKIRDAIGEDAVIVATRTDDSGEVRITVAIDQDAPEPRNRDEDGAARDANGASASAAPERPADRFDAVYRAMRGHGVPAVIGEAVLGLVEESPAAEPHRALAWALSRTLSFEPRDPLEWNRPLLLVGPPGAGKTQTTVKLAARSRLRGRDVTLMTIDTSRTAGLEALEAFAGGLRLELLRAEDPTTLAGHLQRRGGEAPVLIDSAGRNHLNDVDMTDLAGFAKADGVEPLLVLPAGLDAVEAADVARAFQAVGARRLIVTRADTTRRLGSVLAAAYAGRLALAEVSETARIKDGLRRLTPQALAELLLVQRRFPPTRTPEENMR